MKKNNFYLRVKTSVRSSLLWVLMVVAIIWVFSISMNNYTNAKDSTEENAKMTMKNRAEQCAEVVNHIFNKKIETLQFLTTLPEINQMDQEKQKEYILDKTERLGFESIFIVDSAGNGYYFDEGKVRDQSKERFFEDIMASDLYITSPFYRANEKKSITTICVPIYNGETKVGVICGVVDLSDLYMAVQDIEGKYDVMVLDTTGTYVASSDMMLVNQQKKYFNVYKDEKKMLNFIKKAIESEETTVGETSVKGEKLFAATADIDYCHWKVCMTVSSEEVMGDIQNIMKTQLISIGLMLFILICIAIMYKNMLAREKDAFIDPLSGTANRASCSFALQNMDENKGESAMLVTLSIDDFMNINETHGMSEGDKAIKAFGNILEKSFGKYGFVGRISEEGFISILTGGVEQSYYAALSEMNDMIDKFNSHENAFKLSVIHGNAVRYPSAGEGTGKTSSELLEEAGQSMNVMKSRLSN